MRSELPPLFLQRICDLRRFRDLLIIVEVRMGIQPCLLVLHQMLLQKIVGICPISEHSVIAGHRKDAPRAVISPVRMSGEEGIQSRHDIIISHACVARCIRIETLHISLFIQHKLLRKTGRFIGVIIA